MKSINKDVLIAANREYKEQELQRLTLGREQLINRFGSLKEQFLDLEPDEKLTNLAPELKVFSMFDDDEVVTLMHELKIGKGVTKYFVNAESIFDSLDKLFKESDFLWYYEAIWEYYMMHSKTFFFIQLSYELGYDLDKVGPQVKRQEKQRNLPKDFLLLHDSIKSTMMKIDVEKFNIKLPVFEDSIIKSMKKNIKFSHKYIFHNLYHYLLDFNKEDESVDINISDFKCDFYDLVEILLRDNSILKDDIDSQLNYGKEAGNRRFKIKRVDSLFLNLS